MRNISLYESFISDYGGLISNYRNFQEKHKRDTAELWKKYRDIIEDIFTEMHDNYKTHNKWRQSGFHSAEGQDYGSFLEYLDFLFIEHFGNIELFNEKLKRNPLCFELEESQNLNEFIENILECSSKFNVISDSFGLTFLIGCPVSGKYTSPFNSQLYINDIDSLRSKVNKEVVDLIDNGDIFGSRRQKNNTVIVRFHLSLVE